MRFFVLLALLFSATLRAAEIDAPAPDFALKDLDGVEHRLSDQKGNVVVLEWTHRDCPFTARYYESGEIQAMQKAVREDGGIWFTIASGQTARDRLLFEETEATAVLLDEDATVAKAFETLTTAHMFVINAEGNVVYNGALDDHASPSPTDGKDVDLYVLNTVHALTAGEPVPKSITRPYGCSIRYLE